MMRQVLKLAMTRSIMARILLTCLLNSFSQSSRPRPCGFLIGVIIPLPTYPLSATQSAGVKLWVRGPRPAREQGPVDEVLAPLVQVIGSGNVRREHLLNKRGDGRYCPADCRLGSRVRFGQLLLNPIQAQVGKRDNDRLEKPERRRPALIAWACPSRVDQRAQLHDLIPGKSRGMIQRKARFSEVGFSTQILSSIEPLFM